LATGYAKYSVTEKNMAEYGEWNRKGATLSDVTAKKEYGVDRDFFVKGIRTGKLDFRKGAIRLLRSQLEQYTAEELGKDRLSMVQKQTELRKIKAEGLSSFAR
jgi:hypothetical protein